MIPKCDCMLPCSDCNAEREQEMLKISEEILFLRDKIQELEDERLNAASTYMMVYANIAEQRDEANRKVSAVKSQLSDQIDITILRVKERDAALDRIKHLEKSLRNALNVVEMLSNANGKS